MNMEKSSEEIGLELDELNKQELIVHKQLDDTENEINNQRNKLDEIRKAIRLLEEISRTKKQQIRTLKTQIAIKTREFWVVKRNGM